jgi:hypothetical protein
MNFWTYLVNDRLFSEFLAAFHGFADVPVRRIGKLRTLHVLCDIGLKPDTAGVAVDTALDEVVGMVVMVVSAMT